MVGVGFFGTVGIAMAAVTGLVLLSVLMTYGDRQDRKHAAAKFVAGRQAMTDEEFLHRLGPPQRLEQACLAWRQAMADVISISREFIYPEDRLFTIMNIDFEGGGDFMSVSCCVDKALGIKVPRAIFEKALMPDHKEITVGELGLRLCVALEKEGLLGGQPHGA